MRKFIALTGALLLALPGLAFAQVKTQTKGGDWAAQPTAPGDFTRAFKLPQKIGDVTINFRSRVDIDFQSNRNQDFDSDQADSALLPTTTFGGGAAGPKTPGRKGEFFEFEDLRFGFDASGDRWAIHTVMEADDLIADREGADSVIHVERWWGDYDFGYFNIRIGNQIVGIEPGAMVWTDDDAVARIYKDYGTVAWSIYYSKRQDADSGIDFDAVAGRGGVGAPPGGALTSQTGIGNDQDVIAATLELAFANPIGAGTLSFAPFFVYNDDKRFQRGLGVLGPAGPAAGAACGITCDGDLQVYTAGATIAGKIWQIDSVLAGAYQWGDDNTGINSVNPVTGSLRKADIAAWYAFANLAWPIPNTPLTIGAGVMVVSGDDDPFDDKAKGYLGVAHNTEFGGGLGGIDIWVDEFDTAIKLRDNLGPGGTIRTGNSAPAGNAMFLTTDDDPTPLGLSNVAGVFGLPAAGIASGSGPALDPDRHNNRSHPGVIMANANLSYRATKDLLTRVDVNPIWFYSTDGFHPFLSSTTVTPSGLSAAAGIDKYVGTEIVFTSLWRPWGSPYFSINPGVAVIIPGSGIEDLTGTDDIAVKFHVSFTWSLGI